MNWHVFIFTISISLVSFFLTFQSYAAQVAQAPPPQVIGFVVLLYLSLLSSCIPIFLAALRHEIPEFVLLHNDYHLYLQESLLEP